MRAIKGTKGVLINIGCTIAGGVVGAILTSVLKNRKHTCAGNLLAERDEFGHTDLYLNINGPIDDVIFNKDTVEFKIISRSSQKINRPIWPL